MKMYFGVKFFSVTCVFYHCHVDTLDWEQVEQSRAN